MQMWDTVLALLALFALCAFYATRKGVMPGVAPLLTMATVMVWLSLGGVLGLLWPAGLLLYLAAAAAAVYLLFIEKPKPGWHRLLSPGILLFAGLSVVALVYFAVRQPVFSGWDEFSLWGAAPKLMKLHNSLHTTAEAGWFWTPTEKPGLMLLGYFTQFFGGDFAPWKVYFGYAVLLFACAGACLAPFEAGGFRAALPIGLAAVLAPFFIGVPVRTVYLPSVYMSCYGDMPAGMLFGGTLAVYFAQRGAPNPNTRLAVPDGKPERQWLWPALLVLVAFALTKDNVFPIVLVAGAIMALDLLLTGGGAMRWRRFAVAAGLFIAPVAAYLVWGRHAAWANAQNPYTGGAQTGTSPIAAALGGLGELLRPDTRSERFNIVLDKMSSALFDSVNFPVSMAGSGFVTALLILALFALAAWLAVGKRQKWRVALAGGMTTLGFCGYQYVLLVSAVYISKSEASLGDYLRYVGSYFTGWFLTALCLLAAGVAGRYALAQAGKPALAEAETDMEASTARAPSENGSEAKAAKRFALSARAKALAGQWAALLLGAGMLGAFCLHVLPGYSVLDYPQSTFDAERAFQAGAEEVARNIEPGARTFFVHQGDPGDYWFRYAYYLLPRVLDYSYGGGTFGPPVEKEPAGNYNALTLEEMEEYLQQHDCTYIFVDLMDETFEQTYGPLFTDGLDAAKQGPALYRRAEDGRYAPVWQAEGHTP